MHIQKLLRSLFPQRKNSAEALRLQAKAIQAQQANLEEQALLRRQVKDLDLQIHLFAILLDESLNSISWQQSHDRLSAARAELQLRIAELERTQGEVH